MKAVALLSGGIDSPVAIHLVKKKLDIVAVHFHQMPLTGEKEITKVKKLAKKLKVKKLYIVPFADVLKALVEKCEHRGYYILSKIAMFQAAEEIANEEKADYLVTGENLAQVSSQTLSNIKSIDSQLSMIVLRPLLTHDKLDTIKIAKEIETYNISKGPEICSLLGPKNPLTKSKIERVESELKRLDLKKLIKESVNKAEIIS